MDLDEQEWEDFSRRVKAARRAAGLSQGEITKRTGISQGTLSAIEGMNVNPSLATILRLAKGLGVPAHSFFIDAPPA